MLGEPDFEARAVVAEKRNRLNSPESQVGPSGPIGGLSRIFGGSFEQPGDLSRFIHLLRSFDVAKQVRQDDKLLTALFPHRWDEQNQEWKPAKQGPIGSVLALLGVTSRTINPKPSVWHLQRYLSREVVLVHLEQEGFWVIRYRNESRDVAIHLLDQIVTIADNIIRVREQDALDSQATYIQEQIESTIENEHRVMLFSILRSVEQRKMLSASDQTYAFEFLDPPFVPELARMRNTSLYLLAGAFLGLFVGITSIAIRPAVTGK